MKNNFSKFKHLALKFGPVIISAALFLILMIMINFKILDGLTDYLSEIDGGGEIMFNVFKYFIIEFGSRVLIALLFWCIYIRIRKFNEKCEFNSNSNTYLDYPKSVFWLARYIFGYNTINMTEVPVPLQFYFHHKKTFKNIKITKGNENSLDLTFPLVNCELDLESEITNDDDSNIYIYIGDTYPVTVRNLSNFSNLRNYTFINRLNIENGIRVNCRNLIDTVLIELQKRRKKFSIIHLYLFANPLHVREIVNGMLTGEGRDGLIEFRIYYAEKKNNVFIFTDKYIKIKN